MRRKAEGNQKGSLPAAEEGRKRIHGARPPAVWFKRKEKQNLDVTKLPFVYQSPPWGGPWQIRALSTTVAGSVSRVSPQGLFPLVPDPAPHLFGDVVDLPVLFVDLAAHVHSHGPQVADDAAHGPQVLLHLILPCVVGYSAHTAGRFNSASAPDHRSKPGTHLLM